LVLASGMTIVCLSGINRTARAYSNVYLNLQKLHIEIKISPLQKQLTLFVS
jgi:hypothetical protein